MSPTSPCMLVFYKRRPRQCTLDLMDMNLAHPPAEGKPRGTPHAGYRLAALVVVALPIALLWPAMRTGRILSSADTVLGSYLLTPARPLGFVPQNSILTDPAQQFIPWRRLTTSEARAGQLPFWNPYAYAGSPLLGNSQAAVFDPLAAPYFLTARPDTVTVWVALLRLTVAGLGAFLFVRALECSPVACALAGLAYGCGGFMIVWLLYPHSSSAAWAPWALWAGERMARKPAAGVILALGLAVGASVLGGHVEAAFVLAIVVAVYTLWRHVQLHHLGRRTLTRTMLALSAAGALTMTLTAVHTLPFLEALEGGTTVGARGAFWSSPVFASLLNPIAYLPQLVRAVLLAFPYLFGRPLRGEVVLGEAFTNYCEHSFAYASLLAACLAAAATARARRGTATRVVLVIGVVTWLYCGGFPPIVAVVRFVPVVRLIVPTRAGFIPLLALAVLAGLGLDALVRSGDLRSKRVARLLAGVTAAGAVTAATLGIVMAGGGTVALKGVLYKLADPQLAARYAASFLFPWAAIALASSVVLFLLAGRRRRSLAVFALAVVAADLWYFGAHFNPAIPAGEAYPTTPAVRAVQRATARGRVVILDYGMVTNVATYYAVPDIAGYDAINRARLEALARVAGANDRTGLGDTLLAFEHFGSWFFDVMAVQTVIADRTLDGDGLVLRSEVEGTRIYTNTRARPFVFAPLVVRPAADQSSAAEILRKGGYDRINTPVVETRDATLPAAPSSRLRWERPSPERISIDVDTLTAATLVVAESYDRGWTARVDGAPAAVLPCDLAVMAVVVPAGHHKVQLVFRPRTWSVAVALTTSGVVGCFVLLFARRRHA